MCSSRSYGSCHVLLFLLCLVVSASVIVVSTPAVTFPDYYEALGLVADDHTSHPPSRLSSVSEERIVEAFALQHAILLASSEADSGLQRLNEALATLIDPTKRAEYDFTYAVYCDFRRRQLAGIEPEDAHFEHSWVPPLPAFSRWLAGGVMMLPILAFLYALCGRAGLMVTLSLPVAALVGIPLSLLMPGWAIIVIGVLISRSSRRM